MSGPHLELAHAYWTELVRPGDIVIDATCGNGHDTSVLARLALTGHSGELHALDIQPEAIQATETRMKATLSKEQLARTHFHLRCHSSFPCMLREETVKLVVYNLGYLPGGEKALTTRVETTLQSVRAAQALVCPGGAISLTCYPGHPEGAREQTALLEYLTSLQPSQWSCCHHAWLNRPASPTLTMLQLKQFIFTYD